MHKVELQRVNCKVIYGSLVLNCEFFRNLISKVVGAIL